MSSTTVDDLLSGIYFNPSAVGSYGGVNRLYQAAKKQNPHLTRKTVSEWLQGQETYSLYKPRKLKFQRNRVISSGILEQVDVDLGDLSAVAEYNDGVRFIVISVDTFSRKMAIQPTQSKKADDVVEALRKLWDKKPKMVRSDQGLELTNKKVQSFFKEQGIHHFTTRNTEVKSNFAEAGLKRIKGVIYKYFTHKQTHRYIDQLQTFVTTYNNSIHSALGMAPNQVNAQNERGLWWYLYWPTTVTRNPVQKKFAFKIGDKVRTTYIKHAFTREYDHRFTTEIFTVSHRYRRDGIPVYRLVDYDGENIEGTFYAPELQKVKEPSTWRVEKIIKSRKRRGHARQHLIRWAGHHPKHDSWVNAADVDSKGVRR